MHRGEHGFVDHTGYLESLEHTPPKSTVTSVEEDLCLGLPSFLLPSTPPLSIASSFLPSFPSSLFSPFFSSLACSLPPLFGLSFLPPIISFLPAFLSLFPPFFLKTTLARVSPPVMTWQLWPTLDFSQKALGWELEKGA